MSDFHLSEHLARGGKMIAATDPSLTIPHTNDLLERVDTRLEEHQRMLSGLVEFARLEHDARVAAEDTAQRWRRATLALGVLTLLAAIAGAIVAL